jgi:beta-lactamase superfamily II metal-dependent hydrolase
MHGIPDKRQSNIWKHHFVTLKIGGGTMRKALLLAIVIAVGLASPALRAQQKKALEVYFIDVEGGQSTLFVSPTGQSLLVDTGWAGARDSGRIVSVAKAAGVSQIDYLVLTHYHGDHAGGVVDLAKQIPIKNFVDHGPSAEETLNVPATYAAYLTVRGEGKHIQVKPGDKVPIAGLDVQVISAAAETISKALPGAGADNPDCGGFVAKDEVKDPLVGGENKQSVGMVISLGKFRIADFGDLTWNKEHDLACPKNLIGTIDAYVVSHHGQDISSLPMLVHAERPRVAIMDNGANKGGAVATFETLKSSPGLEDLWQLHFAEGATDHNMPEKFIANLGTGGTVPTGVPNEGPVYYIQLTARQDGSFSVKNSRNDFQKDYAAKH